MTLFRSSRWTRVLLVTNQAAMATFVARNLLPEYDTSVATTAQEALDELANGPPADVVLVDLHLPEASARDVFATLCAERPASAERVVLIGARARTPGERSFLATFPNEIVHVPFTVRSLRQAVASALARLERVVAKAA